MCTFDFYNGYIWNLLNLFLQNLSKKLIIILNLVIPEVPPSIELSVEGDVYIKEGDSFRVTCSGYGNPAPHLKWSRIDDASFSDRIMISDNLMLLPSLTLSISKAELADFGSYICLGRSSVGVLGQVVNIIRSKYF